jgi:hypothetical protein
MSKRGLKFFQFMKNRAHHDGIRRSPYRAMFGCEPNVWLLALSLPNDAVQNLSIEEKLDN